MMDYHQPVLVKQSIEGLNIKPDGIYVDATFGGGGHSREIFRHLKTGKLIGFDQDEDAYKNIINDKRFVFVRHNFRFLKNFLRYHGFGEIDGLLADLGVSSHHFDEAGRGFSFRFDNELDMRMNRNAELTAREVINSYSEADLKQLFVNYGEIKNASKLASAIRSARMSKRIESSRDLIEAVKGCIPPRNENQYLATLFQSLRIEVNHEIESLSEMLMQTREVLKTGGRLVIISYHSLEDRMVKNFIRSGNFRGEMKKDVFGNISAPFRAVNTKVIVPSEEEIKENNRARSARLRIAERVENDR